MSKLNTKFAKALKSFVLTRGTIAQACAATRINRQQFNKYLAGQVLPGARNMRKICLYLRVSEEQLMSGARSAAGSAAPGICGSCRVAQSPAGAGGSSPPAQERTSTRQSANVLQNGLYDCYFTLDVSSALLIRCLLSVRQGRSGQTFTFRTSLRGVDEAFTLSGLAKYNGDVIPGVSEAYLVGTSRISEDQPGVLAVSSLPGAGQSYYSGMALTRRREGLLAITAALKYRGREACPRQALSAVGLVGLDDPVLDPVIAMLMNARPAAGANWMHSVTGKNLRPVARPGGSALPEAAKMGGLSV